MLHVLFLLAVLGLEFPQLLLLLPQLLIQLRDLLVIVALLVKGLQRFLLFALHLKEGFILVLDRLQNPLLVLQLILQLDYPVQYIHSFNLLLDVVGSLELPPHGFDLLFIKLNLILTLLEFSLLLLDSLVFVSILESSGPSLASSRCNPILLKLFLSVFINELFEL